MGDRHAGLPDPVVHGPTATMPADAKLAASALFAAARGKTLPANVSIASSMHRELSEMAGDLAAFRPRDHVLLAYRAHPDDADHRILAGLLDLDRGDGRRLRLLYGAVYGADGRTLRIGQAHARVHAGAPRTRLFVVPEDDFPKNRWVDAEAGYESLLRLAAESAVPPGNADGRKGPHRLFVFLRDPVRHNASLRLVVADRPDGTDGYRLETVVRDFSGWRVLEAAGDFALGGDRPLFLKVVYLRGAGNGLPSRDARLAGVYQLSGDGS